MEDAAGERVEVTALQEVIVSVSEYKSFDIRGAVLGYVCPGVFVSSKARDGRGQGGVVLLVRKLYKSTPAAKFSCSGGSGKRGRMAASLVAVMRHMTTRDSTS